MVPRGIHGLPSRGLLAGLLALAFSVPGPATAVAPAVAQQDAGPGQGVTVPGAESLPRGTLVVCGGRVFDAVSDTLRVNPGLVVVDGRFSAFGADAAEEALGQGAELVELADGEVLLPGFFDLHAHYAIDLRGEGRIDETEVYPVLFLANGVTSTFPAGEVQPYRMKALGDRIAAGERIGPRLYNSGPYFGSNREGWDEHMTAADVKAEVDYWIRQGAQGFKAKGIAPRHLQPLVERAHHHGVTVTGHLGSGQDDSVNPKRAIEMGIDRVEHFLGGDAMVPTRSAYASLVEMTPDMPEVEEVIRLYVDEGVYFDATLSAYGYYAEREPRVYDYFHDEMKYLTPYARELVESGLPRRVSEQFERIYWAKRDLIKKFYDMGGGHLITAGTDHPSWGEYFSGFGIHRELHVMVLAGLPEAAALKAATVNGARALGVEDELGTIEVGKIADFTILRGNPLEDIRATRDPRLVFKGGEPYAPRELLASVEGELGPSGPEELDEW